MTGLMMIANPIKVIHESALRAPKGSLDTPIYGRNLEDFSLLHSKNENNIYIDVPVSKIHALGRNDFWKEGETWRMATHHLHGNGWDAGVFDYFVEPLKEKSFGQTGSVGPLDVTAIGGFFRCYCGNHRLVAGRAWLTERHGENAKFKAVKVTYFPLEESIRRYLVASAMKSTGIRIASADPYQAYGREHIDVLLDREDEPGTIYGRTPNGIIKLLEPTKGQTKHIFQRPSMLLEEPRTVGEWISISPAVIRALLDDQWIAEQLPSAERWKKHNR
jgi:hypothetical protein